MSGFSLKRSNSSGSSSKKDKEKGKQHRSSHERRQSESKHPLLDSRMDDDPSQPIIDYSRISTSMRDDASDSGNPFADVVDPPETTTLNLQSEAKRQRRTSLSLHRTSTPTANTTLSPPMSPHRRSSSNVVPPINSEALSSSSTATRLKRSPSSPINGESHSKEAQLLTNFVPASPTALSGSPRNGPSSPTVTPRPADVSDLNGFSSEKQFTKKNIYYNLLHKMQLSIDEAREQLAEQITEFSTYQDTQMRAINQRHALLVTLLADVSRGDVIKLDTRGNYNGTERRKQESSCCCCFSFLSGLFDTTD